MHAPESTVGLDRAIETIVNTSWFFIGRDASCYLEAYKVEMLMGYILEAKRLIGFASGNVEYSRGDTQVEAKQLIGFASGNVEYSRGDTQVASG